jgi:hypothetical protein
LCLTFLITRNTTSFRSEFAKKKVAFIQEKAKTSFIDKLDIGFPKKVILEEN